MFNKQIALLAMPFFFASTLHADVLIDDFSNGPLGGGTFFVDSDGPAFSFTIDTPDALSISAVPGKPSDDNVLRVSLPASVFAGFGHTLGSAQDWSPYPAVNVWVFGNATGNEMSFNVADRDGGGTNEVWVRPFIDNFYGWKNLEIAMDSFELAGFSQVGDGMLNTDNIEEWSFYAVTGEGTGVIPATYYLDDVRLVATPANTFGISILDVKTGEVTELSNPDDIPAFNPSFSNNGKDLVFDTFGDYNGLMVANIASGNISMLEGGEFGNDASWSADDTQIAFDRFGAEIMVVSSDGGTPQFVTNGYDPEWNNNGKRIAFGNEGAIYTANIDGSDVTLVSSFGIHPTWSSNGKQIAFSDGENLWMVDVDQHGKAKKDPVQITFDGSDIFNQQPSWSNNGKSIAFHSNRDTGDFDIWLIDLKSGDIERLTGIANAGDFDPSYSKNAKLIAFGTNNNF